MTAKAQRNDDRQISLQAPRELPQEIDEQGPVNG